MASDIDVHIGRRLRRRRRLLGLTQQKLGEAIGMRFQQVQKYECAANRITADRLYRIAVALRVPTTYFYEGLPDPVATNASEAVDDRDLIANDVLGRRETLELIRAYYMLSELPRRRLLDLAKVLREDIAVPAA
jgi:transcriptional regulator with XRE-family HTH domain